MYDPQGVKNRLENIVKRVETLPERNKELLLKFRDECYARGLSDQRVIFYLNRIKLVSEWLGKDFDKATKDDIKALMGKIERSETYSRKLRNQKNEKREYTEWTKSGYRIAVKKFFQWVAGMEWDSKEYSENAKWIKTGERKAKLKDPIILTKDEIRKMFEAAEGTREKALVSFMYETGCRCPDELLKIKICDLEWVENGVKVKLTSGKVGARPVLLVSCLPYLKAWVENEHPNPEHDSYLWVNKGTRNHGKLMSYSSLKKLVKKWVVKAKINKTVTPYTFRRTRYTHLANKIPTPALYKIMGQVQGSDCIQRYVALSSDDVDETMLNFYGVKQSINNNHDIKPLFCPICKNQAPPEKQFCPQCNAPLTEKAKLQVEEKKNNEIKNVAEFMIKNKMKAEFDALIETIIQKKLQERGLEAESSARS